MRRLNCKPMAVFKCEDYGYFWKGEDQRIVGMKQRRIKALLAHDINLLAYHLPLDVHPEVENNVQLAQRLG